MHDRELLIADSIGSLAVSHHKGFASILRHESRKCPQFVIETQVPLLITPQRSGVFATFYSSGSVI
jgi:hypothetical protein